MLLAALAEGLALLGSVDLGKADDQRLRFAAGGERVPISDGNDQAEEKLSAHWRQATRTSRIRPQLSFTMSPPPFVFGGVEANWCRAGILFCSLKCLLRHYLCGGSPPRLAS